MNKNGVFISFEGPEASGKSSQLIELKKFFYIQKISFIITREPGGTLVSEKLRKIILNKKYPDGTYKKLLNSHKIKKLGWRPKVSLDKGIAQTIKNYPN